MPSADPPLATMSSPDSPTKRRDSASSYEEEVLILLLAANPSIVLSYKTMAALSGGTRTAASLEHKFRKWKARAKEIKAEHEQAEGAEGDDEKGRKTPVAKPVAKRPRATAKKMGHDSDADEEEGKKLKGAKRARKGGEGTKDEPVIKEEIQKAAKKLANASKTGSPEKAKVQKKGTARIVKKTDGLKAGGDEELVELKGKGKNAKVNVVESKAKGRTAKTGNAEEDEGVADASEELGEMEFELEDK